MGAFVFHKHILLFLYFRLCLDYFKYQGRKKIVTLSVISDSSMGRKGASLPSQRRSAALPTANGSLPPTYRSVSQYGDIPQEPMFHSKLRFSYVITFYKTVGYFYVREWVGLTHYQTTNFRLVQTERGCRRQFQIWRKWQKVVQVGRKHCGKRRNCSLWAISLFSHSVFKRLVSQGRQKVSLCGNGLRGNKKQ